MSERGGDGVDERFDRRLADLLAAEAEDVGGAPTAREMTLRVARRVPGAPRDVAATALVRARPPGALRVALLLAALTAILLALLALVMAQRPETRLFGDEGMIVLDERAIDPVTGETVPGPCPACGPDGLPRTTGRLRFPSWSADGTLLAYLDPDASVMVVDVRSGVVTPTGACVGCVDARPADLPPRGAVSMAPDGRQVAFAEAGRIKVVDVATRRVRELTDGDAASAPAWSPDGRTVAYMVGGDGRRGGGGIWLVDADGQGTPRRILEGDVGDPAWSPDGMTLAYTDASPEADGLWVIDVDGRQPRRLTTDAGCFLSSGAPVWAPDGSSIAVGIETHAPEGMSCGLWLVDPSDPARAPTRLADGRGSHAAWRPSPVDPGSRGGPGGS